MKQNTNLESKLRAREQENNFRQLKQTAGLVDFCSNDYLGLAQTLKQHAFQPMNTGSGGSRLLAGNYPLIEEAERTIAAFHEAECGLIFNSGYDANLGLLSCIGQRGDTYLYDQLSHASLRDGIRLSFAQAFPFRHNDLEDLETQLKKAKGTVYVITESVFSMDGDMAPLNDMADLCDRYGAYLVVDEAHATGIIGTKGEGLVQLMGLQHRCFARIHTFGKALGCHGAIVLGRELVRNYLINFSRPFIYTTALPPVVIAHIMEAYRRFPQMTAERNRLTQLIDRFRQLAASFSLTPSETAIQAMIIPGNDRVVAVATQLQQAGFDVRPIRYPTVPAGSERLRVVMHSFNTPEEVDRLMHSLLEMMAS